MARWGQALPVLAVIVAILVLMAVLQPSDESQVGLEGAQPSATVAAPSPSAPMSTPASSPSPGLLTTLPPPSPRSQPPSGSGSAGSGSPGLPSPSVPPEILCPAPPPADTISVVSYNIKGGRSRRGTGYSIDRIARELQRWRPDVVLLQEVDRFKNRSRNDDQPDILGQRLEMAAVFGSNVRGRDGEYGTAILSRFPITDWSNHLLPESFEQRGVLRATVTIAGRSVDFFNTHLQNRDQPARLRQIRAVGEIMSRSTSPRVLGGDFNATPGNSVMGIARSFLFDTWRAVGRGEGATHPASNPRGRIDFLLHSAEIQPLSSQVIASDASDHNAVRAVYRVDPLVVPCG